MPPEEYKAGIRPIKTIDGETVMFSNQSLKRLLVPLVIEQILVILVGMTDTLMVSSAGETAVSGVALVDMVNYLMITVLSAVATGGAVVISQYLGGGQEDAAKRSAGQLMVVSALISTAIAILCVLFRVPLLHLLFGSVEEPVMHAALLYFAVTACSFPFLGLYNGAAALFRSMGKTDITMWVSLLMNLINIVGDVFGVLVCRAGILGVAIPTLISRVVAAFLLTALAFGKQYPAALCWKNILSLDQKIIPRILRIAVPGGIENGSFALGKVLVTTIVSRFGTTQIAANGVSGSINQIAILVVSAVNLAVITVVGQCVGARKWEEARAATYKLMKISYCSLAILGGAVILFLPLLLRFYQLPPETLRLSAVLVIMHNLLAFALHPTSFNLANSLRAAGDVKFTMYVGIGSMLLFRLGSAVLFGIVCGLGIIGVWIAMGMDWLARSVAFLLRYRSRRWQDLQVA